jgi:hypothetical protein
VLMQINIADENREASRPISRSGNSSEIRLFVQSFYVIEYSIP